MLIRHIRNQRGDTIVEVLIAIAVVSLVLVTAYATSTRNINTLEDTQEHSEALQLAQTQIEYLHDATQAARGTASSGGCFDNAGAPMPSGSSNCKVDASDTPTGAQPQFQIVLTSTPTSAGLNIYQVQVTWQSLLGGQTNNVTLYYQQA